MSDVIIVSHHKVGDTEWNAVRKALAPFVAVYAPGAQSKLDRMADAVVSALRSVSEQEKP